MASDEGFKVVSVQKSSKCWPWRHRWVPKDQKGERCLDQCSKCLWWRIWGVSTSGVHHQTFMAPQSFISEFDYLTGKLIGYRWAG